MVILNHRKWKGPPWVLTTNVEDFRMSVETRFRSLAKGNAALWQNLLLESHFQAQEYLTPFLFKSDEENSCE